MKVNMKVRNIRNIKIIEVIGTIKGLVIETNDDSSKKLIYKKDFGTILGNNEYIHDMLEEIYFDLARDSFAEELDKVKVDVDVENKIMTVVVGELKGTYTLKTENDVELMRSLLDGLDNLIYLINDSITVHSFEL